MGILDGKVAIVTGASKGLGKGEAFALAKEGAKVAVLARSYEGCVETAREIEALGGEALPIACDVCQEADIKAAVAKVVEKWGTVDILVNNAQIMFAPHPIEDWTWDEMDQIFKSGPYGTWAFMVACLPYMKEKGGRIVNFTSATAYTPNTGRAGYAAAKQAIHSLTRTAAREWGKYKINVNIISPVAIGDMIKRTYTEEQQMELLKSGGMALSHRWGDAEKDIGRGVVFLCGPDSEMITGCMLPIDGGSAML